MEKKVVDILLIEDDNLDVIDMQRSLDKMSIFHRTQVARNGEEALEILAKGIPSSYLPDIVLLDINMPKMNGFEFLHAIRKNDLYKDLKVFIITTSDERVDREAAKKLGVSGYIVKPLKLNNPSSMDSFNLMIDLLNMKSGI
ncbi:MAG TPA: response regulator [Ohtaekwangia sp.]|nr:response regulator [Ohtaekwangia sp.]